MTDDDVLSYVEEHLSDFAVSGPPVRLPEGNLNLVWRVPGEKRSVVVKYAPPYIAANPDVPLDPSRLSIEAECLLALSPEGDLASLASEAVRAPRPLSVDAEAHVLVMEDLGDLPTLGRWIRESDAETLGAQAYRLGEHLGTFIGRLHAETHSRPEYADRFNNRAMQETRHAVQYEGAAEMLEDAGISDAQDLAERAEALGRALLDPGQCLTMGDLWPASVLVDNENLRIIDWELAHYGRALQDIAHWLAHLWMQRHRAPTPEAENAIGTMRSSFLDAYVDALGSERAEIWTREEGHGAAVHFGCEILVRAVGPFRDGYVYDGLDVSHPDVQYAVDVAARHLRNPAENSLHPSLT